MTLADVVADIDRQRKTFMRVFLDRQAYDILDEAIVGNDEWSGLAGWSYCLVKKAGGLVYQIDPARVERVYQAGLIALTREVTKKLTGETF